MGIPQQGCCARNLHPPDPTSHSSSGLWVFDAAWLNSGTEQPPSQHCPPLYQSYAEPKKRPVTPEQSGIPKNRCCACSTSHTCTTPPLPPNAVPGATAGKPNPARHPSLPKHIPGQPARRERSATPRRAPAGKILVRNQCQARPVECSSEQPRTPPPERPSGGR